MAGPTTSPMYPLTVVQVFNALTRDGEVLKEKVIQMASKRFVNKGVDNTRLKTSNLCSTNKVQGHQNSGVSDIDTKIIADMRLTNMLGGLSQQLHSQCINCPYMNINAYHSYNAATVETDFMIRAECKNLNGYCPDQQPQLNKNIWDSFDFVEGTYDQFGRKYAPPVVPKVEEKDIELEIMRLDENYGLF